MDIFTWMILHFDAFRQTDITASEKTRVRVVYVKDMDGRCV